MPMYNKDTQPTEKGLDQTQSNKFKDKYNAEDMNENITGIYLDEQGKRKFIEFKISNVKEATTIDESYVKLELSGMGNLYANKLNENKELPIKQFLKNEIETFNFYVKEGQIFKSEKKKTNESSNKENISKMLKLMNYNPTKHR